LFYFQRGTFFCTIDVFPLDLFSIHNFNLRNLKGNGNALVTSDTEIMNYYNTKNTVILMSCVFVKISFDFGQDTP